jgi:hypothetical protein
MQRRLIGGVYSTLFPQRNLTGVRQQANSEITIAQSDPCSARSVRLVEGNIDQIQ